MKFHKKDVRKIKHATQEELGKLHQEYEAMMKNVRGLSPAGLLGIAVAGVAVILFFNNFLFDLLGLVMLFYPLYIFIKRGAHKEGYFEGYYDLMTKAGKPEHAPAEKSEDVK